MKIVAICNVDEEKLKETSIAAEDNLKEGIIQEFGWMNMSGITPDVIDKANDIRSETHYQAFMWDKTKNKYVKIGRPFLSKRICKARLLENIREGWIASFLDSNKYKICKCEVYSISTSWKDEECEE